MKPGQHVSRAGALLCVMAIASCDTSVAVSGNSFQSQYTNARDALEKGRYQAAGRMYERLLDQAGVHRNRISLELAHTHLRAENFGAAEQISGTLVKATNGTARAAALAVQATALHEIGLQYLSSGDQRQGAAYLRRAQSAIDDVLASDPELDPLGSLAGRKASISVRLAALS